MRRPVAFFAMFAVFPGLAAAVAVWGMVADPSAIQGYLTVAERFLPPEARALVHVQVMGLIEAPPATLGWTTFVSLAIAIYSARAGVSALVQGLDVVHRSRPRGFIWGWVVDFILTAALLGALFLALVTVVVVPIMLSYVQFGTFEAWLTKVLPWGATGGGRRRCVPPPSPLGRGMGWGRGCWNWTRRRSSRCGSCRGSSRPK